MKYFVPLAGASAALMIAVFPFILPSERMRRGVKRHVEILSAMPEGKQRERLQSEVDRLTSRWLNYKDYMHERRNNYVEWLLVALMPVNCILQFMTFYTPGGLLAGSQLAFYVTPVLVLLAVPNLIGAVNLFRGRTWIGQVPNEKVIERFRKDRWKKTLKRLGKIRRRRKMYRFMKRACTLGVVAVAFRISITAYTISNRSSGAKWLFFASAWIGKKSSSFGRTCVGWQKQ